MSGPGLASAIASYRNLLHDNPSLARESAELLASEQQERKLTFGGTPLCGVLRPHFLTRSTYSHIQQVGAILSAAMFRLADGMLAEPELLEPMGLSSIELDLIRTDPGFREISPTSRLDSFMTEDSWQFVEYNAETPAAIAYEDVLSELFLELPVMQAFGRSVKISPLPARHQLLACLLDAYRQWGGRDLPAVAIVDWAGLPTADEFELFARYFAENDIQSIICEPRELSYDGTRLHANGKPIDLVYKRVLTAELLARPEVADPLVRAYQAHHVCVVNSFRSKLLHKKMIFALLSDDRYAHHFTAIERAVIARHIPWTRQIADGASTHGGKRIDLLDHIRDNRDSLVLKPNDEYGGKGVVIGWESGQGEWEQALTGALSGQYVAQERVPVAREQFPIWSESGLQWTDLAVDLDPYLFGTQVNGALTRLSAASLLNVTAGTGSVVPTFVVD